MYYYDPDKDKSRRWAALATLFYALAVVVAFVFVSFDLGQDPLRPGEGLLIDFGTTETGAGVRDLQATDVAAAVQRPISGASRQEVEYETDERSDVEVAVPRPQSRPDRRDAPGQTSKPSAATEPAEEPRTVNRRALFPGRTAGSDSSSEGPSEGSGNAGDPSGAPDGNHEGSGQSDAGIAYDLSGRSVVGQLPEPFYPGNESGKVVVEVSVDAAGRVNYAAYRAQGSTTDDKRLIDAAVEAARKSRFSTSESRAQQYGTITYVFTLE